MKKINLFLLAMALVTLNSCEIVGDIFQAGAAFGIIIVIAVLVVIVWLFSKLRG